MKVATITSITSTRLCSCTLGLGESLGTYPPNHIQWNTVSHSYVVMCSLILPFHIKIWPGNSVKPSDGSYISIGVGTPSASHIQYIF